MASTTNSNGSIATTSSGVPTFWLLELFSSVWLGVSLAVLLFIYCSVGSAAPQVRQLPWLEMTEFEWFHWWPFNILMIAFTLNMVIVTIRRIPFRFVNAGVLMIHSGIIMMTLGSYYYFSTKVEGDTPVFRRHVQIEHPHLPEPVSLVVLPGASKRVTVGADVWQFRIQSTNSAWPILSDEHAGEKAYAVNVSVQPPKGEPFIRQLLAGYAQYTEDIMPGKGRAIKNIGRKLVDQDLKLTLEYEPQTYFHVMDSWALFSRVVGDTEWIERSIDHMPRYNDRIASRDQVFFDPRDPVDINAIDLPVPSLAGADPLSSASVHITGYLRYAHMQRRWRDGGRQLNPVVSVSVSSPRAQPNTYELAALHPTHAQSDDGLIDFRWLTSSEDIALLPKDSAALLHIEVPEADVSFDVVMTQETVVGPTGDFTPIGNTEFSYRIRGVQDNLTIPGASRSVSIAMVEIKTPEGSFRRWVANNPELTRDIHGEGVDAHALDTKGPDPRIVMAYTPPSTPIILAGHPGGLHFVYNGPQGRVMERPISVGQSIELLPGISVHVTGYWQHAQPEEKPFIVPPASRQKNVKETFSMIRLEIGTGQDIQTHWLTYHPYALPNEQYAYGGRFRYDPTRYRMADGKEIEVIFSRRRQPLPYPVVLDNFELDTHLGGYTGASMTIRNYVSTLRFQNQGQWTKPTDIRVNDPTSYGEYWFFQSIWDRPSPSNPAGGMNYTGLGVGNRHGVYIQLAGCCLSVIGMCFAFYVKPVLKRRRAAQQRARLGRRHDDEQGSPSETVEEVAMV